MRFALSILLCLAAFTGNSAVAASIEPYVLYADFDNKSDGVPIDTRGASFGEPVSLGNLDATVVATSPGQQVLHVENDLTSTSARKLRWELLGNGEITEGEVRMHFDFTPSALDGYKIVVRESTGSTKQFLNVVLTPAGTAYLSDGNGVFATVASAYSAGTSLTMAFRFNMDTHLVSVYFNGSAVALNHDFAITNAGIGSLSIGYSSSNGGSAFELDNIAITGQEPFPVVLEADMDKTSAGNPIGTGGAEAHEPWSIGSVLNAMVMSSGPGNNILEISSTNTSTAAFVRWQFLDNIEIRTGVVILDFQQATSDRDLFYMGLREPGLSSQSFGNLIWQSNGIVSASDAQGYFSLSGASYVPNQVYHWQLVFDMDAGTWDIFRDGAALSRERAHGLSSRGLGAFLNGILNGAAMTSRLQIDSLRVYASDARLISSELEFLKETGTAIPDMPVSPAIEVGVMNVLDQAVPNGTLVRLDIVPGTGPVGASLDNNVSVTSGGVASFPALSFDQPGIYRLEASSMDASVTGNIDVVVSTADVIFEDGFE